MIKSLSIFLFSHKTTHKMNRIYKTATIFLLIAISGFITISNWTADSSKARIKFEISGPFGMVHGGFTGLKTAIVFNESNLAGSTISASIDASTVSTGIGLRNRDLRTKEEWFNTRKYPLISFNTTKIEKTDNGYKAIGHLTIKGISKATAIPFTFKPDEKSGLFKSNFTVLRSDFHLGHNGGSVGNSIKITLEVPVKK